MRGFYFVPPNEELEGTLHPQKFGCTPKNDGKRVHVPPDEKTCGHADIKLNIMQVREDTSVLSFPILYFLRKKLWELWCLMPLLTIVTLPKGRVI